MDLEERKRRMKEAGIPMPITQVPLSEGSTSTVPVTAQNMDKHAKLQALKKGANRQKVQELVNSKKPSGPGGFQPIPEPKMRKNPNNPQSRLSDPSMAVKPVENFGKTSPIDNELKMIEDMMSSSNSPSYNVYQQPTDNMSNLQPELSINQDGYGPEFNPANMLAKKRAELKSENQYMQYAVNQNNTQQEVNQNDFDFQNLKSMMEQVAKNTISEVLNNYTENNSKKLTFEYLKAKTKDGHRIIKTSDNNYYKIIPVKIKKD